MDQDVFTQSNVPQWVANAILLLTLAAAYYAARGAWRQVRRDEERRESKQAAAVSAWVDSNRTKPTVALTNRSTAIVSNAHISVMSEDGREVYVAEGIGVLPPDTGPVRYPLKSNREGASPPNPKGLDLTFIDAAGVSWLRDSSGTLKQIQDRDRHVRILGDHRMGEFISGNEANWWEGTALRVDFRSVDYDDLFGVHLKESARGSGPDLLIGAHDWLGRLAADGAIDPVWLPRHLARRLERWTVRSVRTRGRSYAIPISIDTSAMIINKRLLPNVPETFEGLLSSLRDLEGSGSGRVTRTIALRVLPGGDPFQIWPIFSAAGGQLLDDTGRHVQLDSSESIRAWGRLGELAKDGFINRRMTRTEALRWFNEGESAVLISTADVLPQLEHPEDLLVTAVPPYMSTATPVRPFSLTLGVSWSKMGDNRIKRSDMRHIRRFVTSPQTGWVAAYQDLSGGPPWRLSESAPGALDSFAAIAKSGEPMPNWPQMKAVWDVLREAELRALDSGDPTEIALSAAEAVRRCMPRPKFRHAPRR